MNDEVRGLSRCAAIVGIGHTDWRADYQCTRRGEKPNDATGYGALAFKAALADAGLTREDIDGLIVGPTTAYERMAEVLGLDVRWGGAADAAQAVMQACLVIYAGLAETSALVYGNDQRSAAVSYGGSDAAYGAEYLSYIYHAPWGLTSQGALYAMTFQRYMQERNFSARDLGQVAVAQRQFASLNPNAIMREPIHIDDYLASRYICEPLRLLDYCLVNDGGVALIITHSDKARRSPHPPAFIHGIGRYDLNVGATSLEPRLTNFYLSAQQEAARRMFDMASVSPSEVDALQVYDSFSCHVPMALEGYGYCAPGDAARFMQVDGIGPGSRLPVNTSGGHLSESYMQGWNHQIEAVRQLRGECGKRQIAGCRFVHYCADVAGKAMSVLYGH